MKALGLLLALILIMPTVLADVQYSTFDAWLNSEQVACQCGVYETTINILNTGSDNTFTIEFSGSGAQWATVAENFIFLKQGEQRQVPVYVNIPCNANTADLFFTVSSINGVQKDLYQDIPITRCSNLQVEPIQDMQTANPCRPLAYTFDVFNAGNFQETYEFETSEFKRETQFLPESISLFPQTTATVTAIVTPACDEYGEFDFEFTIKALSNDQETSIPVSAYINRDYGFTTTAGYFDENNQNIFTPKTTPYEACINENYVIPIRLTNDGSVQNTYDLDVSMGVLSEYAPTIPAHSSKLIALAILEKNVQQEVIVLDIETELGDFEQKLGIPVDIQNCYDATIHAPETYYVNQSTLYVGVTNDGSKELNVQYALAGSPYLHLQTSEDTFTDQSTVAIAAALPHTGVEKATLYAQLNNGDVISKDIDFIFGQPFWHTYGDVIAVVIVLLILFIVASIIYKKKYYRPKRKVKPHSQRVKKALEDIKKEKSVAKKIAKEDKKRKFCPKLATSIALLVILIVLFFLPIPTFQNNQSNSSLEFEQDNMLRINLQDVANSSYYGVVENDDVHLQTKSTYLYIASENTTQTEIEIRLNGSEAFIPVSVVNSTNETFIEHGVNVYKTIGILAYDDAKENTTQYVIYALLLILFIAMIIGSKSEKSSKKNQPKTKRFTLLEK